MTRDSTDEIWTIQLFAIVAGQPWFALQLHSDGGIERQFTGYRREMDDLTGKLGISPEELPAITEEEFFSRCP